MINLNRNITFILFVLFLFILNVSSVFAFDLLPGEPETCGDGVIDSTENLYNCNKDISPSIIDYFRCINKGSEGCIYHKIYTKTIYMMLSILGGGFVIAYLISH